MLVGLARDDATLSTILDDLVRSLPVLLSCDPKRNENRHE